MDPSPPAVALWLGDPRCPGDAAAVVGDEALLDGEERAARDRLLPT